MGHKYHEITFTDAVKSVQAEMGSRAGYARREGRQAVTHDRLGPEETAFIANCDSFYMATVSETGWPYIQHRGGPKGFLRVLDEKTIGFADFSGNRQYVSVGNLATNDRVSLFLMDYTRRARLKMLGRAAIVGLDAGDVLNNLVPANNSARVERGVVITLDAFDWNCPQHIPERFTTEDVERIVERLTKRIVELEGQVSQK